MKTDHMKASMDKMQPNRNSRLCSDRGEMINHIISECSKLAQKVYRHDWVGKGIHWEMCKKLKFDKAKMQYMYKPSSVLEMENDKLRLDFDIQIDHIISTKRP